MSLVRLGAGELDTVAALLADGLVVAVPTDTVYGLAATLANDRAVASLFEVKRRPRGTPVAVLCATTAEAASLATSWPPAAQRLAAAYWPGPLTLVVLADPALVTRLGATRGVGVRVPNDPTCAALLARTGPLAVTSANLHGEPPATSADDVEATFRDDGVAAVLDDGVRDAGVSLVLDLTGTAPIVVREGALDASVVTRVATGA